MQTQHTVRTASISTSGDRCDDNKLLKPSGMIHMSEVDEVNKRTAELLLYKADSLLMLTHSAGASSAMPSVSTHL